MNLTLRNLFILLTCTLLAGCDMFDSHPYDGHIHGEKGINEKNIAIIENTCLNKDTMKIAFTGDTQNFLEQTEDMVSDINKRGDVDFLVHLGDFTDYGMTQEFVWQTDILNKLSCPYVGLIGNHDVLGTGMDVYESMFGEQNFSFIAGRIKFLCLNTNAMEYDYSNPIPNFGFMKEEAKADSGLYESTIVCMHARPGTEQFNNNVYDVWPHYVQLFPNVLFCISGHEHEPKVVDVYGDGMQYYVTASGNRREYYLFTITKGGYKYETIHY